VMVLPEEPLVPAMCARKMNLLRLVRPSPRKNLKAGGRKWNALPIQFSSSVLVRYIICKTMSGGRGYEGGRTRMVSDICGDRTQNTLHTSSNTFSVFVFQLTTLFLSGNEGMLLVKF
jgi:hypothetical protein